MEGGHVMLEVRCSEMDVGYVGVYRVLVVISDGVDGIVSGEIVIELVGLDEDTVVSDTEESTYE